MKSALLIALCLPGWVAAADPESLAMRGDYAGAAGLYLQQAKVNDPGIVVPALLNAATCMKMSGDVSAAALHLESAREWMGMDPDPAILLEWLALKGSIQALSKRPATAIAPLRQALALAEEHGDPSLRSDLVNDLGIALSASERHAEALAMFEQAVDPSAGGGKLLRARQNHLVAAFQHWFALHDMRMRIEEVGSWPGATETLLTAAASRLESSLSAAADLLDATNGVGPAALHLRLTAAMVAHRSGSVGMANRLYASALAQARESGIPNLESSALLGLAEQYADARRFTDALCLLDEARLGSTTLPEPDLARLEILTAVARHALAPSADATGDAIRRAVATVETIRSDLARSQSISDLGRGFRDFAGRPYLLLADHLLRRSVNQVDDGITQVRAARDAVEAFKTWELNDFYRDDCVNLALETARDLDQLDDPSVALIYVIPLDDRTELLVTHDSGMRRFSSPMGSEDLHTAARRFRYHLESDYGTYRFLEDAELLHQRLVKPALGHLRSLGVRHLVFVLDGSLGNLPPGALFDPESERYLLEDFSVSIAPNLSLLSPTQASGDPRPLLVGGVSEAAGGFAAIPAVDLEIDRIAAMYPEKVVLKNLDFTKAAIREKLLDLPADVVHIASHGEFLGRAEECFLLTRDGRITLDELEEMIRPKKFVGIPVGLLCLSACRTAAGDDRAALGLAGASVKSGARSVVATLWYIEDQATAGIMTDFHGRLRNHPQEGKAESLRQAQLEVLRKDPSAHPSFWAPFILVGSWQ